MLTRWDDMNRTLAAMGELRRRMDRVFDRYDDEREFFDERPFGSRAVATWPRINLVDAGAHVVVTAEVPGLGEKDVELTLNQNVLSLKGERKSDVPEGYGVHRQERAPVRFARSFAMPWKIDPDKTTASVKDGVLTVTLAKAPEAQPRQIAVKAQ